MNNKTKNSHKYWLLDGEQFTEVNSVRIQKEKNLYLW